MTIQKEVMLDLMSSNSNERRLSFLVTNREAIHVATAAVERDNFFWSLRYFGGYSRESVDRRVTKFKDSLSDFKHCAPVSITGEQDDSAGVQRCNVVQNLQGNRRKELIHNDSGRNFRVQ